MLKKNINILLPALLILLATLSRLLPHPFNFTPIGAVALFGSAVFPSRYMGIFISLASMLITDSIIGFHSSMWAVYLSFFMIGGIGLLLRNRMGAIAIFGASLASSVLFFVVTNFAVWLGSGMYSMDMKGLTECFVMAIPFFGNTFGGDIFYCIVLFGSYALSKRVWPSVQWA
ncbi:MAG: DUF6580 family putative transport protein [Cytophagales bacterium]|nr:DUF6580 family putative transport protein [Cytophagales bacterium]